jgi:hypothetical protein
MQFYALLFYFWTEISELAFIINHNVGQEAIVLGRISLKQL